jgi:hypothetical protein
VNTTSIVAVVLSLALVLFGVTTGAIQYQGLRRLAARSHVPSDEYAYLCGKYRRRLITGVVLAIIGGLIGGAFLSGLEPRVDALTAKEPANPDADEPQPKREMTPEQKQLVRMWVGYWSVVLVLVFVLLGLAFADAIATRRYAMQQYQVLREEHQTKLRRDLAVYRAQKGARGGSGRPGNRMTDS